MFYHEGSGRHGKVSGEEHDEVSFLKQTWTSPLYPVGSQLLAQGVWKVPGTYNLRSRLAPSSTGCPAHLHVTPTLPLKCRIRSSFFDLHPPHKKFHSFKTLVCADDFTESLQCQREFISHKQFQIKCLYVLVLTCPWATLDTKFLSLATFFSDFHLLPCSRPWFFPLSRPTFLYPAPRRPNSCNI